ncbi:MAG: SusC/RagA family TonB-linked outer membrane protein [Bacteroidales bacterium]|nr:SusC/RagA family TonB-linked outer membrane protein [Bacteroidales bacterium]
MKKYFRLSILTFFLLLPVLAFAQNLIVKGNIVDSSGETVLGAYILEKDTQNGTTSDIDGNFSISVKKGATLAVSFLGFKSQEIIVENADFLNIIMTEDSEALEELIVVGYATGKKRSISGAVERITAEDMNVGFIATPMDAIRSKVSGLVISYNGGDPTGTPTVRLRGTSSLSGETGPLFVIDGMFTDISTFNSMNAADIENITVLKDAAETAQYGSRGASGVIVVTTYKGQQGTAKVDYKGQAGASIAYKQLPIMSADEWRNYNTLLNAGGTDHGYSTNFYKEIQNNVVSQQNHNVSMTMGNQQANMRASLGVNQRKGQIKGTESSLYNMRFESSIKTLKNKVIIDFALMGSRRNSANPGSQNLYYSASQFNPTFPTFRNPETGEWDSDPSAQQVTNPLGQLEQIRDTEDTRASAKATVTWLIAPGLSLSAFGTYDYYNNLSKSYTPNDIQEGKSTNGSAHITNSNGQSVMGNIKLSYVKDIGKHSLNFLTLAEAVRDNRFNFNARATSFETNYFTYNNLSAGANVSYGSVGSSAGENTVVSYMGRFNYMYDNRYVVTVNLRTDGSSKLGINHKWGFFPSASAAWLISNESFLESISQISNLKLRVGYGLTGNQNGISSYNSLAVMRPNGITTVDGSSAVAFSYSRNSNPDLKWETKYTFNVGADLAMFNSRLRATLDYYQSITKDLLYTYSVPVPPFLYNSLLANIGEMSNEGVELSISGNLISTKTWGIILNVQGSYQKSTVDKLSGFYGEQELSPTQPISLSRITNCGGLTQNTGVIYMSENMPYGYFCIPQFQEFTPDSKNPDRMKYKLVDQNGDGRIRTQDTSPDRVFCGQAIPKFNIGASIQIRYKNFEISTQLSGAFGHMIYNSTSMLYNNMANFPAYNVYSEAPNRMIYDIQISDYWLEKGDYINIDYISLGWNAPVSSWNDSVFQNLRVAISCNNVATFTGYSGMTPLLNNASYSGGLDDRGVYPISRTFMLSLQLGF